MAVLLPDRAPGAPIDPSGLSLPSSPNALLALSDGSVWHGWSGLRTDAVAGPVEVEEGTVRIAAIAAMILAEDDARQVAARLARAHDAGNVVFGCAAATGAILPIHEAVARAVAQGRIGLP